MFVYLISLASTTAMVLVIYDPITSFRCMVSIVCIYEVLVLSYILCMCTRVELITSDQESEWCHGKWCIYYSCMSYMNSSVSLCVVLQSVAQLFSVRTSSYRPLFILPRMKTSYQKGAIKKSTTSVWNVSLLCEWQHKCVRLINERWGVRRRGKHTHAHVHAKPAAPPVPAPAVQSSTTSSIRHRNYKYQCAISPV